MMLSISPIASEIGRIRLFLMAADNDILLKTAFPSRKFHKSMVIMMKSIKLTTEEKAIEKDIDKLRPVSVEKRKRIEKIISQAKKNKSISLRISNYDLDKIKEKAYNEGMPYQTLINSILHKYITNQLLEKDQIIKSVKFISES